VHLHRTLSCVIVENIMISVNVEVKKNQTENSISLIRRFTRRVQGSGVLTRARALQYRTRMASKAARKTRALKRIQKRGERERLKKLGKIPS